MTQAEADPTAAADGATPRPAQQVKDRQHAPLTKPGKTEAKTSRSSAWSVIAWAFRIGLALVIVGVGFGLLLLLAFSRPEPPVIEGGVEPPAVETIRVVEMPVAREWAGYGAARAMDSVNITAQVSAVVTERAVGLEAGVDVEAGQRLFVLERDDFERRLEAAEQRAVSVEAQLAGLEAETARLRDQVRLAEVERDIARRDLERVREADEAGAASPGELDSALAAVQRAERSLAQFRQSLELIPSREASLNAQLLAERSQVALAERELARTLITAPFAGRVQRVGPEVDELVSRGELLVRVVDLRTIEVPIRLPVSIGLDVRVGDPAELRADAPGSPMWTGVVSRIAPEADDRSRTLEVFVEVTQDPEGASAGELLLPGSFVVAIVRSRVESPRIMVPRAAITGGRVLVAEESRSADGETVDGERRVGVRDVEVAFRIRRPAPELDPVEREWAVLAEDGSALRPGDLVIVSNVAELRVGVAVTPVPRVPGGGADRGEQVRREGAR